MKRTDPATIQKTLLWKIFVKEKSPVVSTAKQFKLSREGVYKHLRELIKDGLVTTSGEGRNREYSLAILQTLSESLKLEKGLDESKVWSNFQKQMTQKLPEDVLEICEYGFTEMVNNAIDHSEGTKLSIAISTTALSVTIMVLDNGVGIFNKIASAFNLAEPREAILELYKGKLTTDPEHHSGEGIFFSSRAFNLFTIVSSGLVYFYKTGKDELDGDWLVQSPPTKDSDGTLVAMLLLIPPAHTLKSVFEKFASEDNDFAFSKTHVPLKLAMIGEGNLVSRSQAKRVLARFDKFEEVMLDFEGIQSIGQGFADEIFRVFRASHPNTKIRYMGAGNEVAKMINRAQHHQQ